MNLCSDCKWWGDPEVDPVYGAPEGWRTCRLSIAELQEASGHKPHDGALMYAKDHEDYGAELITAPEFGCIQWAPQLYVSASEEGTETR